MEMKTNKKVCVLLLHNRHNSGLYYYAGIYKDSYPGSKLVLLSDLYPHSSQWIILLFFLFFRNRIKSFIEKELQQYDLVHICDNPVYSGYVLQLLKSNGIKTLFTLHDPEPHLTNTFKGMIKNMLTKSLLRLSYRRIARSPLLKLHLHNEWPVPYGIKPLIAPHPIYPVETFLNHDPGKRLTIGFFGRLEYYKGFDIFLDIVERLDRNINPDKVKVVIAGQGELPEIPEFANIVLELHHGFVENALFDRLVSETDIILLPYRQATQSGVLLKALSFNVPVITSEEKHLTCYLKQDETGKILSLENLDLWVKQLEYFVHQRDELHRLSANISQYRKLYDPVEIVKYLYVW